MNIEFKKEEIQINDMIAEFTKHLNRDEQAAMLYFARGLITARTILESNSA